MRITYFIVFLLFISFSSIAQDSQSAGAYMSAIGEQFNAISQDMMSYISAASHGKSARKVDKKRTELIQQTKEGERAIRKLKPFNGNVSYRDSVINYFRITHILLTEDYAKLLDMEDIAEQSYDLMEAYMLAKEKTREKADQAFLSVRAEQERFATENNINLISGEQSKLSQKLEESGKVSGYYQKLYLLFFKSYKNEAYLLDALSKGDINAMEQSKNSLLTSATEDYEKTGPIPDYKGDNRVKNACQQLLNFYKIEASQKMTTIIDFELTKENFEKMKNIMDAKRPAERTQKDIDEYNKAVNNYNKQLQQVNAVHNELNKKRSQLLDNWNKSVENFFNTYTPRYR